MNCCGVLADDLTGAMDAGMQLLKSNIRVKVVFNADNFEQVYQDCEVIIGCNRQIYNTNIF